MRRTKHPFRINCKIWLTSEEIEKMQSRKNSLDLKTCQYIQRLIEEDLEQ